MEELKAFIKAGDQEGVRNAITRDPLLLRQTTVDVWLDVTPLHLAVLARQESICRLLVEMGADLTAKAKKTKCDYKWLDVTPLHLAIVGKHEPICRLLVEMGADLTAKAKWQWSDLTPLHLAIIEKQESICRFLVEMGADLTAKAKKGFDVWLNVTPLHMAIVERQDSICRLLVEMGADLTAIVKWDNKAYSVAELARSFSCPPEMIDLLESSTQVTPMNPHKSKSSTITPRDVSSSSSAPIIAEQPAPSLFESKPQTDPFDSLPPQLIALRRAGESGEGGDSGDDRRPQGGPDSIVLDQIE